MIDYAMMFDKRVLPADLILSRSTGILPHLICNGQRPQTPNFRPSRWSHISFYVDSCTLAESTIDYKHYATYEDYKSAEGESTRWRYSIEPTGSRMDNGPQYNDMDKLGDCEDAALLQLGFLSMDQRQKVLNEIDREIRSGLYKYDITGLVGSLLTYWAMPWMKSNPLSGRRQLYCSAFVSRVLGEAIGYDICPGMTDRNTSPELIWQAARKHPAITITEAEIIG